jgi:ElaB/YqjD/DUF883 family membrane-anchored ribosome-binding protein
MKSVARDAGQEGVYAAKRLVRRVQHGVESLQDEAAYRVKREPIKAVAVAAGVGVVVGVVLSWIATTTARRLGCKD